ncbi:hypothetical protein B0T22DRAFT_482812 [Podospora appendiculata]|uniref:Uncharacterized protein n=1 Tax=Podospora appendiculata TaxID=314037 RepID=A0AAE0X686_9PEZI|nr:hypothetical protein B0T22DRAFT_482812 [Podospora appendiculata]
MSTVSPCPIAGNPQLYGLGIRIAFYLLWLGILVSNLLIEEGTGVRVLRAAHLVFSSAVVLGLVMSATAAATATATATTLAAAEVYVMVLLVSTTAYFLVPLYLFRLASGCRPEWDPLAYVGDGHLRFVFGNGRKRSDESEHSPFGFDPIVAGENLLWLVVAGVQLWFWCAGVAAFGVDGCVQYGFLFAQVELGGEGFRAFNILVVLGLLGGTLALAVLDTGRRGRRRRRRRRRRRVSSAHKTILANLQYFSDLGVVIVVIAAVELSIKWNNISAAVNQVSSAAQLIPVLVSGVLLLIMMRHWATDKFGGDEDGHEDDGDSGESGRCANVERKPDPSSSSSSWSGGVRGAVPPGAPGVYFGSAPVMGQEPPPGSVVTTTEEEEDDDNRSARGGDAWTVDGESDGAPYRVVINPPARVTEPPRAVRPPLTIRLLTTRLLMNRQKTIRQKRIRLQMSLRLAGPQQAVLHQRALKEVVVRPQATPLQPASHQGAPQQPASQQPVQQHQQVIGAGVAIEAKAIEAVATNEGQVVIETAVATEAVAATTVEVAVAIEAGADTAVAMAKAVAVAVAVAVAAAPVCPRSHTAIDTSCFPPTVASETLASAAGLPDASRKCPDIPRRFSTSRLPVAS